MLRGAVCFQSRGDPGLVPAAVPCNEPARGALGAPRALPIDLDWRWRVEQRLHDPPRLLDAVLAGEPRRLPHERGVEENLVGGRAFAAHLGELDVEVDRPGAGSVSTVGV